MVKKVLSYENIQAYNSYDEYYSGMTSNLDRLIPVDKEVEKNQYFLRDMIKQIGKEMQRCGAFDLVASQTNEEVKKNILTYMYTASIDAFHENAIEQRSYEQLTGRVKYTGLAIRGKLVDIVSWA